MTTGIFNTSGFTQDLAAKSFAGMITRLMPNGQAPLFGMTSMLPTEQALQVEHGFFTKTMLFPMINLDAAVANATDTTFTVASTTDVLPGMLMRAESTGEVVIINSILSATQVSVTRGVGSTAAAIADNVNLYQIGNAFEESSVRPNALQINPVRITNYTQIFRNTWALSGSAQATQVIAGETTVAENRMDCAAFHAADIEKALFFGTKSQGTRNGQPFRTMDGLRNIILNASYYPASYGGVVNNTTAGATTNFTQLETALDPVFNQATDPKVGNERVLFVGGGARKVINNIGRLNSTYYIQNGATSYGLQFGQFNIARGSFRMIEHPLFNSNADWSKYAIAVDLSTFRVAYLGGRKTMKQEFNMNGDTVVDNGIDAVGGTLTTELTCVVKNPPANAIITNLTAAAAG
jgi:Family of unknown function (DUF5309)